MVYNYYSCSRGHIYRVIKTKEKYSTTCPYCGSTWKSRSFKSLWLLFKEDIFAHGLMRDNRDGSVPPVH